MSSIDYQRVIEENFRIVDKNEKSIPFVFNPVQKALYDSLCGRDIILKARQEGVSSLVLAMFTVDFIFSDNSRSVCIAHDKDSTIKLFDRVKYFLKAFELTNGITIPLAYNTRTELVNLKNNAYFYIGAAGSGNFGRSATLTNVHFSEMAFYPSPEKIYLAASQAGTPKRVIIESTAWGFGDFFNKMWDDAVNNRNNYMAHFFGWQDFPQYAAPSTIKVELTTAEQKMKERFKLTDAQLAWRRVKLSEFTNETSFQKEYPMSPEEAFVSSGNPVFNTDALQWYKTTVSQIHAPLLTGNLVGTSPPAIEDNPKGFMKIWRKPTELGQYVIGADVAEGTMEGDYCCAQVLDRKTFEQVAVWHGRADPDVFGRELFRLGTYYNSALIAPERNSIGLATLLTLRELYYPNLYVRESIGRIDDKLKPELGWSTDIKTKPLMVSDTVKCIRDKLIILHDEQTLYELFSYQFDESGHANAVKGAHDDRVVALMIAVQMYYRTPLQTSQRNAIAESPNEIAETEFGDFDFGGGPLPIS